MGGGARGVALDHSAPGAVPIELLPAGQDCEMRLAGGNPVTRLGLDALRHMLVPVIVVAAWMTRASAPSGKTIRLGWFWRRAERREMRDMVGKRR